MLLCLHLIWYILYGSLNKYIHIEEHRKYTPEVWIFKGKQNYLKLEFVALAEWLSGLGCHPIRQNGVGSIAGQGRCVSCGFSPQNVCVGGNLSMFLSHINVSLSLPPFLSLLKTIDILSLYSSCNLITCTSGTFHRIKFQIHHGSLSKIWLQSTLYGSAVHWFFSAVAGKTLDSSEKTEKIPFVGPTCRG